jgi:hypothetical protein
LQETCPSPNEKVKGRIEKIGHKHLPRRRIREKAIRDYQKKKNWGPTKPPLPKKSLTKF